MALIREQARGLLRRLVLPVPTVAGTTLNVVVTDPLGPARLPMVGTQCLCHRIATYAWRAAHEHGCSRVRVHLGLHKHEFDTIDLLKFTVRRAGWLPGVKRIAGRVPRFLATRGHQALGATLDVTRPTFHVPISICGGAAGEET